MSKDTTFKLTKNDNLNNVLLLHKNCKMIVK